MSYLTQDIVKPYVELFEKNGYKWFDDNKPYNMNVFGVRAKGRHVNLFDDFLFLIYRDGRLNWNIHQFAISTDPGVTSLNSPQNSRGTAILVPGQYLGAYKIDKHQGKYDALCQRLGKVKVYRDNNKDDVLDTPDDTSVLHEGMFGINIHRSSVKDSEFVNGWSAGCQVFKKKVDFDYFMALIKYSAALYGNRFTYTLFDERDIEPEEKPAF